ncbi:hypothetical protein M2322_002836 [Rhodoblastus acidophilus]|uniref:hypothetical protein n=1 Tax=Rhodoblastus acidophilus TaxID=1074 RepID=UPI0022249251|nr:hypothetical protein [Rhodoblastus acidophilus]MCW2317277.1 hypothetical protein [Rhodoblastus acidophilus]
MVAGYEARVGELTARVAALERELLQVIGIIISSDLCHDCPKWPALMQKLTTMAVLREKEQPKE